MSITVPQSMRPFLWSYDMTRIDMVKDKKRIITNILNLGTKEATDWLFSAFDKKDICEAVLNPLPGEWSKKSLHFWAFALGVKAGSTERRI